MHTQQTQTLKSSSSSYLCPMASSSPVARALKAAASMLQLLLVSPFRLISSLLPKLLPCTPDAARRLPLPPGSMGWLYIGETFQLYSDNPINFFALRQRRYGPVFKSHILGCPCVMVSSPEAAKFVLVTNGHLFKPTFPASKERMLGRQAIFFQQGEYYHRLRKLVLRAFMPDAIRSKLADVVSIAVATLKSWEGRDTITTYPEMKTYTFNVALLSIFGGDENSYMEELKHCYHTLETGYNSLPINLPGTLFHRAMKARRRLGEILAEILASRRQGVSAGSGHDRLGAFMEDLLTDEQIADNVIGVIFAARDTTASALTWAVKFLAENPLVLDAVTEEHEGIRSSMEEGKTSLSWEHIRSMHLTWKVVHETLRVASILSFTFREAVRDVEYDGYLIPKGWKVMPLFRNIHHNPEIFCDPERFDPSRFKAAPKPNTFMPFGNGVHACPGNELAKLEILVLLHHLTTRYRWSLRGQKQEGIQFAPSAIPMNGLPINFALK